MRAHRANHSRETRTRTQFSALCDALRRSRHMPTDCADTTPCRRTRYWAALDCRLSTIALLALVAHWRRRRSEARIEIPTQSDLCEEQPRGTTLEPDSICTALDVRRD